MEAHQAWLMLNAGEHSGLTRETLPAIMRTIHTAADTMEKVEGQTVERVLRFAKSLVRQVAELRAGAHK